MSCVIARETGDGRGASLAQSVERFTRNEKVISSILIGSSVENPWKSSDFRGFLHPMGAIHLWASFLPNDNAYGAEVLHFAEMDSSPDPGSVTFLGADIAAIARGFGAEGITGRICESTLRGTATVGTGLRSPPWAGGSAGCVSVAEDSQRTYGNGFNGDMRGERANLRDRACALGGDD